MLNNSFCTKKSAVLLLAGMFLVLSSCSKKTDANGNSTSSNPTPVDYSKSPWIAYQASNQDTIKIKNNELLIAFGARDFSDTRSLSSLSRYQPLTGDFEMSLDYEKASNFFLTVIANSQTDKNATISVSNLNTGIGFGSGYGMAKSDSIDFEFSTSGTMTLKRTGSTLKVTIVKNYISGSTPAQKTHEYSCPNFYQDFSTLTFSALPFTGKTIGVTMKRFSLTDHAGKKIIEDFSSSDSLYVDRNF
jgi:hypothetical protein